LVNPGVTAQTKGKEGAEGEKACIHMFVKKQTATVQVICSET